MARSRAAQAASVALLAALATAVWVHRMELDPHASRVSGFEVDTYRYYWPTAVFLHDELSRGHLPLWNPYQLAGQPYLALHLNALLYPPTWLLAILPPRATFPVLSILHMLAAGLFTWLFAGRLGLGPAARLAAAAGYMLCLPLELGFYLPPYLAAPTWLPALLWALHGLASEARARWAVALAVFAALCFLAGHAQAFVYTVEVAATYGLFALWRVAPAGRRLRVAALAALAGALALGLVAPELLPSLELTREAVRGLSGLSYDEAAVSAASPPQLLRGMLRLFAPFGVGPLEPMLTLPALALPLAAVGLLARARRAHALLFAGLALFVALVMLGPHTPFFALYHQLPLGNLFRGTSRFAFAWFLLFALLLAFGIERIDALGRPAARAAAALLALAVVVDAYALTAIPNAHPVRTGDYPGTAPEVVAFLRADPTRSRIFVESFDVQSPRSLDKLGMLHHVFAVPDYEPNMPAAYFAYFHPRPRQPWHGRLHLVPGRDPSRADHLAGPRLLDLLSVRWAVLELPAPRALVASLNEATGSTGRRLGQALLFERPGALPRAYAVRRVRSAPDVATAVAALEAPDFDPRAEAVVVGARAEGATAAPEPADTGTPTPDRAEIASLEPERIVVRAECAERCLLVLTDLFYPGWRASVDGREAAILRANAIFRGVWLDAGRHEVVFRFEPRSFYAGLAILAATLLLTPLGYASLRALTRLHPEPRIDAPRRSVEARGFAEKGTKPLDPS